MSAIQKVLYTAKMHTTGGRDGVAQSSDGRLEVRLSPPGANGSGTNPEQLLAAGWSACFLSAIGLAAAERKISLPANRSIDTEIDLGTNESGYVLRARLNVSLPGVDRELARELVEAADRTCPYSKATRGNIDVAFNLI